MDPVSTPPINTPTNLKNRFQFWDWFRFWFLRNQIERSIPCIGLNPPYLPWCQSYQTFYTFGQIYKPVWKGDNMLWLRKYLVRLLRCYAPKYLWSSFFLRGTISNLGTLFYTYFACIYNSKWMNAQKGKKVYITLFLVFVCLPIYCVYT